MASLELGDQAALRASAPAAVAHYFLWVPPVLLESVSTLGSAPALESVLALDLGEVAVPVEVIPDPQSAAVRVEAFFVSVHVRGARWVAVLFYVFNLAPL